jgi:hypothetical protein
MCLPLSTILAHLFSHFLTPTCHLAAMCLVSSLSHFTSSSVSNSPPPLYLSHPLSPDTYPIAPCHFHLCPIHTPWHFSSGVTAPPHPLSRVSSRPPSGFPPSSPVKQKTTKGRLPRLAEAELTRPHLIPRKQLLRWLVVVECHLLP